MSVATHFIAVRQGSVSFRWDGSRGCLYERALMELKTILTMIFTIGFVWGGLLFVLFTALRKERVKRRAE